MAGRKHTPQDVPASSTNATGTEVVTFEAAEATYVLRLPKGRRTVVFRGGRYQTANADEIAVLRAWPRGEVREVK